MIDLLFVGDGPRDHATVPHLVACLLGFPVRPAGLQYHSWARLHQTGGGRGYRRQLRFAILQARDAQALGIVATVDADRDPSRQKLRELRRTREETRQSSPAFPTVLAEAIPHAEAWLLDDPVAIVRALNLAKDTSIPTVRQTTNPKRTLEQLRDQSGRAEDPMLEILADIASSVDVTRCRHAKETGFHGFEEEVHQELGPLVRA